MTKTLRKEIRRLMWKLQWNHYPYRLLWSEERYLVKGFFNMHDVLKKYKLSDALLRRYVELERIWGSDWGAVVCFQDLTEQFIRDYRVQLDWMWLIIHQPMTEDFMYEMEDSIGEKWNYVAENHVMSDQFILDNAHRLNYYCLVKNRAGVKLSDRLIYELSERIDQSIFDRVFLESGRVSSAELIRIRDRNKIDNRFELLDIA